MPMMVLPFTLDVLLPATPVSGEVSVVVHSAESIGTEEPPRAAEEAVSLFAMGVSKQLFTAANAEADAQCAVRSFVRKQDGTVAAFTLDMTGVEPESFLVLLSLLAQVSFSGEPISRVSIGGAGRLPGHGPERLFDRLARLREFRIPADLPFEVNVEDVKAPLSCVSYTFRAPLTPDRFKDAEDALIVWGHVVHLGGYLFDFAEQEEFTTEFGHTAHLAPDRLEHVWEDFEGWNSAHEPLINVAAHWHRSGLPLKSVELW